MEYVDGKNLKQLLKKRGKLTAAEVVDIMLQITSAMSVAHDSLIVHRDLKPQNILIKEDGEIKITDFGIAMALNATQLTQTNSAMGSVHYFPPEQANGKGSSLKSDVYSLGIMMYELLTGTLPFRGDNAVEIALKHLKEPIPSIRTELPELPQSIENIIIRATAKNPKNRYANAGEMHEDLKTALNKERENEPVVTLKYDEGIDEDTIIVKKDNSDDSLVKEIKTDEKPKNKKLIIAGLVFTGLIVVLLFAFLILPMISKVPEVTIPDVSNLTEEEATEKLEKMGLTISATTEEENSEEIEAGKVIGTNPREGKVVKEGTEVVLIISLGVEEIEIENYVGQNYIEVKTKLELQGIEVTIEEQDPEGTITEDSSQLILSQSVDPGTKLKKGDKITLYIPSSKEYYPDIVKEGWSVEETRTWAKTKNINLKIVYEETNDYPEGTIIKQSRSTNSTIIEGANLTITVAKKKQEVVETPDPDDSENSNSDDTTEDNTTQTN